MNKIFLALLFSAFTNILFAFTGVVKIDYETGKGKTHTDLYFKGDSVYIKQTAGGNDKYDYFLLNLKTGDFFTVSKADKKVAIKYNFDKLVDYYDANKLKSGYAKDYCISYKLNEKTGAYTGEKNGVKVSINVQESSAPINRLIPLLRLLGSWNEADGSTFKNTVVKSESESKINGKQSVLVTVTNESYTGKSFSLPANYAVKDFTAVMEEKKNTEELKTIIEAFAGF